MLKQLWQGKNIFFSALPQSFIHLLCCATFNENLHWNERHTMWIHRTCPPFTLPSSLFRSHRTPSLNCNTKTGCWAMRWPRTHVHLKNPAHLPLRGSPLICSKCFFQKRTRSISICLPNRLTFQLWRRCSREIGSGGQRTHGKRQQKIFLKKEADNGHMGIICRSDKQGNTLRPVEIWMPAGFRQGHVVSDLTSAKL